MISYRSFVEQNIHRFQQAEAFLPFDNPTFGNPSFDDASARVLIVRLSPFRDVDRSIPHLFLFQEVRRALPQAYVDLAFFPPAGDRHLFREVGVPLLLGAQSHRSADAFDVVLISNAYTLELINLPFLFLQSDIPLFASERDEEWPVFLLGGSNAMASQAIIQEDGDCLVDGIFFGEGEGRVEQLVQLLTEEEGKRERLDRARDQVDGFWWAGSFHPVEAVTCTPQAQLLPTTAPLLNSPEVHAANLQINYGCPAFCSFCFEGYDRKPYRELPLSAVTDAAYQIKYAQGPEEISLYSFNFNTHADVLAMMLRLHRLFDRVGMQSQRADILQQVTGLLDAEVAADKRDFTLGIEGISERMRAFLHKSLDEGTVKSLLDRLFRKKIRRVKLFYILTGHETEEDIEAFRSFARWLKETRRARNPGLRIIVSAGLLVRMPFTPLRYDRLFLEEEAWSHIVGPVKSACETNGLEFRMAFDWPAYCVNQALALGGHWLAEPLIDLARQGYCFDGSVRPEYWESLRAWMEENGHWTPRFLGEKGSDFAFPLSFVSPTVDEGFIYSQFEMAKSGEDTGYCLGGLDEGGTCLSCGACVDAEQRKEILTHRFKNPERTSYLDRLRQVVDYKRTIEPVFYRLRLEPWLADAVTEFKNAFVFKGLLTRYPDLLENALSVREALFSVSPNDRQFLGVSGETVFALRAWQNDVLQDVLSDPREHVGRGFLILGPAEDFEPGRFSRMSLELVLPEAFFPAARERLERYLRESYVAYSLRGVGEGYRFDLPRKALEKRVLFGGSFEIDSEGLVAHLEVGPKFDLAALMEQFGDRRLIVQARAVVSGVEWE